MYDACVKKVSVILNQLFFEFFYDDHCIMIKNAICEALSNID